MNYTGVAQSVAPQVEEVAGHIRRLVTDVQADIAEARRINTENRTALVSDVSLADFERRMLEAEKIASGLPAAVVAGLTEWLERDPARVSAVLLSLIHDGNARIARLEGARR